MNVISMIASIPGLQIGMSVVSGSALRDTHHEGVSGFFWTTTQTDSINAITYIVFGGPGLARGWNVLTLIYTSNHYQPPPVPPPPPLLPLEALLLDAIYPANAAPPTTSLRLWNISGILFSSWAV